MNRNEVIKIRQRGKSTVKAKDKKPVGQMKEKLFESLKF